MKGREGGGGGGGYLDPLHHLLRLHDRVLAKRQLGQVTAGRCPCRRLPWAPLRAPRRAGGAPASTIPHPVQSRMLGLVLLGRHLSSADDLWKHGG